MTTAKARYTESTISKQFYSLWRFSNELLEALKIPVVRVVNRVIRHRNRDAFRTFFVFPGMLERKEFSVNLNQSVIGKDL